MFKNLLLAYDNKNLQDGYYAQLQRILAIYSIAKNYKLEYFHNEIEDCYISQLDDFQNEKQLENFIKRTNLVYKLPSKNFDHAIHVKIDTLFLKTLIFYKLKSILTNKKFAIYVTNPYPVIEKRAKIYKYALDNFNIYQKKKY